MIIWIASSAVFIGSYVLTGELLITLNGLVWLLAVASLGAAQVYRYRTVSSTVERAQTRWVVFGVSVGVLLVIVVDTPTFLFIAAGQSGSIYRLASAMAYTLPPTITAICVGVAILRYRLYDIDVIIRKTLIYSILTGTLAAVYAICGILLQAGFVAVTGQGSALAIVGSTLAIAGLFQPVRTRVQEAVDRRFYRRKYDAARTLAEFGGSLHSEMDLAQLGERVLHVVDETMRPEHLSLWLTQPNAGDSQDVFRSGQPIVSGTTPATDGTLDTRQKLAGQS